MRLTTQGTLFVPYAAGSSVTDTDNGRRDELSEASELKAGKKQIGSWELAKYLYRGKVRIIADGEPSL